MNDLRIFKNEEFGSVRTIMIDNEPYFVGKDVCDILGYSNSRKALLDHVDEEDKADGVTIRDAIGRDQAAVVINESGLYSLVLSSKLPSAKRFKRWVTSEVLPSIRKTGGYELPKNYKEALQDLLIQVEKNELLKAENERMKPKEVFADAVNAAKNSILIGELAKLIAQNGVEIGQKRLFSWLRDNGYLMRSGSSMNLPQQRYIEQGLFEIKESTFANPDGTVRITKTTKVTGKGQIYFINKFLQA